MPLLGSAALLLSFDVTADAVREHDDWHTHEHLPGRLSLPGFVRGTRWTATGEGPGYRVLYEVSDLAALTSDAYLERLNQPTPWNAKIMSHYRGMRRGLCRVAASFGLGLGQFCALIHFRPQAGDELDTWLTRQALPALPAQAGLGSGHLLEAAAPAAMTGEQRIRGADGAVHSAILVTGYDEAAVEDAGRNLVDGGSPLRRGAGEVWMTVYRMDYSLIHTELDA